VCPFVLASFVNLRQWFCANITGRLRDIISVISRLLSNERKKFHLFSAKRTLSRSMRTLFSPGCHQAEKLVLCLTSLAVIASLFTIVDVDSRVANSVVWNARSCPCAHCPLNGPLLSLLVYVSVFVSALTICGEAS